MHIDLNVRLDSLKRQLSRLERRRQSLERQLQARRIQQLKCLPGQVGLADLDELVLALIPLTSAALRAQLSSLTQKHAGFSEGSGAPGKRKFSCEVKARVKAELQAGGKSAAQLSREYGPSHPTIMGWKREWGMTHPRIRAKAAALGM
ncbi:MAG: hypothetical protein ABI885_29460 [Gammaproteobacteria bacterium]